MVDRYGCTEQEFRAVKLYEGGRMPGETDEFYCQEAPYKTLNLLMMAGKEGERVRVCVEGQKPNDLFIRRWRDTLQAVTDIFTVQCRCAISRKKAGKQLPHPLSRGDRGVNFRLMQAAGGTFAFTSTTHGGMRDGFVKKKEDPHALHLSLCEGVPYLDFAEFLGDDYQYKKQREILLPPLVQMEHGPCRIEDHRDIGPVSHYDIRFTGFRTPSEIREETELLQTLEKLAADAAAGLRDLVMKRDNADVFRDADHPYWHWKKAFQQLTLQRMMKIYKSYFED